VLVYRPQLPSLVGAPPEGDRWLHELKHDGYRMGLVLEGSEARVESRRGLDWSAALGKLTAAATRLPARELVLDGEACVLLPDGRTSFQGMQNAFRGRRGGAQGALVYFAFDLLHLDGEDIGTLPLEARKERLQALLAAAPPGSPIRYCAHVVGSGPEVFEQAKRLGCEGIVSKRRDLPHRPGRSDGWLKTKSVRRQELVVGGFTERGNETASVGALLLGYYDDEGHLVFSGSVGTGKGWTAPFLRELRAGLEQLRDEACPFEPRPPREIAREARWVRPALVAEVQFAEWTSDGVIRQATFCGFRADIPARDVRRDRGS
jgi:bifunctional non-homologous end joining protein LigD